MSYLAGALLAIASGAVFNLGALIQKKVVNSVGARAGNLMGHLLREPRWLAGLALQFVLGTPMYAAAQLFIGPTLVPGLMATGLIVLALGSPVIAGEPIRKTDLLGVAMVVAAVALFGVSRLSVDLAALDLLRGPLVLRFGGMTLLVSVLALVMLLASRLRAPWRGPFIILAAGLLYALGNLWLGVLMTVLARFAGGVREGGILAAGGVALFVVGLTNVLSVIWTQSAFRHGKAASLVPLQQVPIQILPALCYFLVFLEVPPTAASPYLAAGGVLLIVGGAAVLGAKQHGIASRPPAGPSTPQG